LRVDWEKVSVERAQWKINQPPLRGFGRFVMEFHLDAFEYKELEECLIGNVPFVR
jgi:hypothetical protein